MPILASSLEGRIRQVMRRTLQQVTQLSTLGGDSESFSEQPCSVSPSNADTSHTRCTHQQPLAFSPANRMSTMPAFEISEFRQMINNVQQLRAATHQENRKLAQPTRDALLAGRDALMRRRLEKHTDKGGSSWLSVLPLSEDEFRLSQRISKYLALRYRWP